MTPSDPNISIVHWLRQTITNRLHLSYLLFGDILNDDKAQSTMEAGMRSDRLQIEELLKMMAQIDYEFGCGHNDVTQIAHNLCPNYVDAYSFKLMAVRYADSPGYKEAWKVDLS